MIEPDQIVGSQPARYQALTLVARIGFGARGLIYLLVGAFAAAAALNWGKQPHGIMDAVQAVNGARLRGVLAASIGIGLACLAAYFAIAGLWHCVRGGGRRRLLFAAGMLGDAMLYAVVTIAILGVLIGWHPDGEQETQVWAAWAMGQPFGRSLIGIVGFLILGCGIAVITWVMTNDIDDDVDLPEAEKRAIEPIGRYGLAGRGLAVALVGVYWLSAALHGDPSKAHELGGALQTVQQNPKGWLLLLTLAVAFVASALFDFVEALYHRPDPGLDLPGCSSENAPTR
jgi:Domain of Unknown Function (DUF1206)